jgi:Na+-driven multidrug efflux pump
LRGAGDTLAVMFYTLSSIVGVRLIGVLVVARLWGMGLAAVWTVLSIELCVRGALMYRRFLKGPWHQIHV